METKTMKLVKQNINVFKKPLVDQPLSSLMELRASLAEAKRKKECTYCGAKYKLKDFRTRRDKDERDLSGMCMPCINQAFNEVEEVNNGV